MISIYTSHGLLGFEKFPSKTPQTKKKKKTPSKETKSLTLLIQFVPSLLPLRIQILLMQAGCLGKTQTPMCLISRSEIANDFWAQAVLHTPTVTHLISKRLLCSWLLWTLKSTSMQKIKKKKWYDLYRNVKELKYAFNSPVYDFSFKTCLLLNIYDRDWWLANTGLYWEWSRLDHRDPKNHEGRHYSYLESRITLT